MPLCIRVLPSRCKKALPKTSFPKRREAGRQKAHPTTGRVRGTSVAACPPVPRRASGGTRSPFGAPPRLSPEAFRLTGSTPGHASWDVAKRVIRKSGNRFSEKITRSLNKLTGVTRLHLSQSRDCTSRAGRSTGVNDAQSRPGAGRNAARGNRSRSTFESTLAKGPSVNEMGESVSI